MTEPERRSAPLSDVTVRGTAAGDRRTISGRAIVYDALSEDLGGFRERFRPGSVKLADDLLVLYNHDSGKVLGRTSAGTAYAKDDGRGIAFSVELPPTSYARDLAALMQRGDVKQCSFAFIVHDDDFHYSEAEGTIIRTVHAAEVTELSVVPAPAYTATSATIS